VKLDTKIRRIRADVAKLLKEKRQEKGLSMREVADRAGLTQPFISYIEKGDRVPTIDTLARLCFALETKASELLKDAGA